MPAIVWRRKFPLIALTLVVGLWLPPARAALGAPSEKSVPISEIEEIGYRYLLKFHHLSGELVKDAEEAIGLAQERLASEAHELNLVAFLGPELRDFGKSVTQARLVLKRGEDAVQHVRTALELGERDASSADYYFELASSTSREAAFIIFDINSIVSNTLAACATSGVVPCGPEVSLVLNSLTSLDSGLLSYVTLVREQAEATKAEAELERAAVAQLYYATRVSIMAPPIPGGVVTESLGDGCERYWGTDGYFNIVGTNGDDVCGGTDNNDKFKMKDGADWVIGYKGSDRFEMEDGNDTALGGNDDDLMFGSRGMDQLFGDDGADTLHGEGGADELEGGNGDDTLADLDDVTNDTLVGGMGGDKLFGGPGDDHLWGDLNPPTSDGGNDNLYGGEGDDTLRADGGVDVLDGDAGNDTLRAGDSSDSLFGEFGTDTLFGDAGSDYMNAGPQPTDNTATYSYGGDGADTYDGLSGFDAFYGENGQDFLTDQATCCTNTSVNPGDLDLMYGGADRDFAFLNEGPIRNPDNSERDIRDTFEGHGGDDSCPRYDWDPDKTLAQVGDRDVVNMGPDEQDYDGQTYCQLCPDLPVPPYGPTCPGSSRADGYERLRWSEESGRV